KVFLQSVLLSCFSSFLQDDQIPRGTDGKLPRKGMKLLCFVQLYPDSSARSSCKDGGVRGVHFSICFPFHNWVINAPSSWRVLAFIDSSAGEEGFRIVRLRKKNFQFLMPPLPLRTFSFGVQKIR